LISLLKYPKQRDMNRAPTSLNAIVGPWNNSREKIPFRLLLRENQNTRYLWLLFVMWSQEFHHLQIVESLDMQFLRCLNFR
jgi:hypothetical protein